MIIGHENQKRKLQALFKKNQTPHAFLFSGPEKIGKKKIAIWFLKMINCQEIGKDIPCERCESCKEIEEEVHIDMAFVSPEKKEIKLEQIEDIISKVSCKGMKALSKGVLIDDAHLMNVYAQNAILKVLEEPPENTVFFLITDYPSMLLPTVASRVFELKFSTVLEKEIEKELKDREIAFLALGRPGVAVDYMKFTEKRKRAENLKKDVEEMIGRDIAYRFLKIKEVIKEETVKDFLECFLKVMHEKLQEKLEKKENTKEVREALTEAQEALFLQSKTNINMQLALEKIMLKI